MKAGNCPSANRIPLNSCQKPTRVDKNIERLSWIVGGRFGRFLYSRANFSSRLLMPNAYADRRKLTREIHEQYLNRFPDRDSRARVLWTLAKSLIGSSRFYESLR